MYSALTCNLYPRFASTCGIKIMKKHIYVIESHEPVTKEQEKIGEEIALIFKYKILPLLVNNQILSFSADAVLSSGNPLDDLTIQMHITPKCECNNSNNLN